MCSGASFPKQRKSANLVLLEKPGRDPSAPGAYRPICLLDVGGKLFGRVVASRIMGHMGADGGRNDLSPNQYGFRAGRTIIDALAQIRDVSRKHCAGAESRSRFR